MKKREPSCDLKEALRLLAGEQAVALTAFTQLYDHYAPIIYIAAKRFLRSKEMADDIVQEVFIPIWQKRKQLSHIRDFDLYLYGMAKNRALVLIKEKLKNDLARIEYAERIRTGDENLYKEKCEHQLNKLVDKLPGQRKKIFQMAKCEGLRYDAIAERLNISVHTVNHNMTKALKFIHERKHDVISVVLVAVALLQRLTGD